MSATLSHEWWNRLEKHFMKILFTFPVFFFQMITDSDTFGTYFIYDVGHLKERAQANHK